jgi:GNAT superfamily N-acetyltransferase
MPRGAFDWNRASVRRFVDAVLALTPEDWERLDEAVRRSAAAHVRATARTAGHPDPAHALPAWTPPLRGWRRVAAAVLIPGVEQLEDWLHAPDWQRQGVGPARLLFERYQHPYVSRPARRAVERGLTLLAMRRYHPVLHEPSFQALAATLNTVLPWDAIWTTPDADGTVGRLASAESARHGSI